MLGPGCGRTAASLHFTRNKALAVNVLVAEQGQNNESQQTGKKQQTNPKS